MPGRAWLSRLLPLALVALSLGVAAGQQARPSPQQGLKLTLDVGLHGGLIRVGYVPCEVLVENRGLGKQVEVSLRVAGRTWTRQVGLDPGQARRLWFMLPVEGNVEVAAEAHELTDGVRGRRLAAVSVQSRATWPQMTIGTSPRVLYVRDPHEPDAEDPPWQWVPGTPQPRLVAALPDHPLAYDGTDLVVLHDVDASQLARPQADALLSWVATGGRVLLIPGVEAAWFDQPLIAELLDGRRFRSLTTHGFPNLARLGDRFRHSAAVPVFVPDGWTPAESLQPVDSGRGHRLRFPGTGLPRERAADGSDYPLAHRLPRGAGWVLVLAVDPANAAFRHWPTRPSLLDALVHWSQLEFGNPWRTRYNAETNPLRRTELIEQLDSREPPSQPFVIGLALLYVACVGPLSYWLLGRRRRRELLVLTVPGFSIVFTLCVFGYGYAVGGLGAVTWQVDLVRGRFGERWAWERSASSLRAAIEPDHAVTFGAGLVGTQIARAGSGYASRWSRRGDDDYVPPEPLRALTYEVTPDGSRVALELDRWEQCFFEGQRIHDLDQGIRVVRGAAGWTIHNRSSLTLLRGLYFGDDYARPWAIPAIEPGGSAPLTVQLESLPSATPNFGREHVAAELWPDDPLARRLGVAMLSSSFVHAPRNQGASSVLFAVLDGVPQSLVIDGAPPNRRVSLLVLGEAP